MACARPRDPPRSPPRETRSHGLLVADDVVNTSRGYDMSRLRPPATSASVGSLRPLGAAEAGAPGGPRGLPSPRLGQDGGVHVCAFVSLDPGQAPKGTCFFLRAEPGGLSQPGALAPALCAPLTPCPGPPRPPVPPPAPLCLLRLRDVGVRFLRLPKKQLCAHSSLGEVGPAHPGEGPWSPWAVRPPRLHASEAHPRSLCVSGVERQS